MLHIISLCRWYYEGETFTMNDWEMVAGNACAVSHENKWLRAELIDKPVNSKIKVCFVDYGTIDVVDITQCRLINKYFSSIPRLCFPGALEFIEPFESVDKELKLVQHFCEMVRNKSLVGLVETVDHTVRFYHVLQAMF